MPSPTATQENSAPGVIPAAPWRIQAVTVLPEFRLAATFKDGRQGVVDCSRLKDSDNLGIFAPLANPEFFALARVELGVLTWPNGADLDPSWLYEALSDTKSWSVPNAVTMPLPNAVKLRPEYGIILTAK